MSEGTIIGIDLAKRVLQRHGARHDESVAFRKKLPRGQLLVIVEAALRPTMRFVAVKTEDQQARAMLFRTWQMFVGQCTQMINASC